MWAWHHLPLFLFVSGFNETPSGWAVIPAWPLMCSYLFSTEQLLHYLFSIAIILGSVLQSWLRQFPSYDLLSFLSYSGAQSSLSSLHPYMSDLLIPVFLCSTDWKALECSVSFLFFFKELTIFLFLEAESTKWTLLERCESRPNYSVFWLCGLSLLLYNWFV